jgi:hypothetical protein
MLVFERPKADMIASGLPLSFHRQAPFSERSLKGFAQHTANPVDHDDTCQYRQQNR